MREAFTTVGEGACATSFPAKLPMLRLDRIYTRGLEVRRAVAHHDEVFRALSDHAPLSAEIGPPQPAVPLAATDPSNLFP